MSAAASEAPALVVEVSLGEADRDDEVRVSLFGRSFRLLRVGTGGDVQRGIPPVMAGYQSLTGGGTMHDLLSSVMSSPSTFERVRN